MKRPDVPFENPFVPDYLTELTIENLPLDVPYYIEPGSREDYEAPAVFVTGERRLAMSKQFIIDDEDRHPHSPLELVGVMRTIYYDEQNGPTTAYVADTRFLPPYSLSDFDQLQFSGDNQEEFMAWSEHIKNVVHFAGFLSLHPKAEIKRSGAMPAAEVYGHAGMYPALDRLRKVGDKSIKRFMQSQNAARHAQTTTATPVHTTETDTTKTTEKSDNK